MILVGQPVTTNPIIIMMINMTIVFAVLIGLQILVQLIHVIDPTKNKKAEPKAAPAPKAAAPAAAAPAAPKADNTAVIAVIAAAVASMDYSSAQITAVRPMESASWKNSGRLSGVNNTVM